MFVFSNNVVGCRGVIQNWVSFLIIRNYQKQPIPVAWKKPKIGWTKLNFDGSSRGRGGGGRGQASIGGIFRNHNAEFLLGFSESIGKATSTVAEFAALKRGLELVLENGWTDLWLEGDAKTLIDIIKKRGKVRCAETKRYADYINAVIPELNNCVLSHVYREGNRAADKLAKLGHEFETPMIFRDKLPKVVLPIVEEEAEGKTIMRRK